MSLIVLYFVPETSSTLSGSHEDNCIPIAKWMSSETSSLVIDTYTADGDAIYEIDFKAICVPNEDVKSFTWLNRHNYFDKKHSCYKCDSRFYVTFSHQDC